MKTRKRFLWATRYMLSELVWCCWVAYCPRPIFNIGCYKGFFRRFSCRDVITLIGSFNLSKRRSKWPMVNSICIFIFQHNIRVCTQNGTSLLSNILIICIILWHIAPRQDFKLLLISRLLPKFDSVGEKPY